ncbi:ABC transporter ATP-binding protein/permease [Roseobacter sp. YSTF-M11]|uniref:ABC transporter ATP-binding protein/permease n=1 Tax=Roseobacter insulae TaxID=2859783 RepID=A0A9X1FZ14_9RHOB|nr:ABC transporter ATP-binding protein [Roseobacter insulae]MBW4710825.1 ABC transporter ATP-binding protein/permease [Roseobacter insulae]
MIKRFQANINSTMLGRLLRENLRLQAFNYGVAIVAMMVIAVTTALTAWIMKDIIDSMVASGNRSAVFAVAAGVAAIFTVKGVATYVQVVFLSRAGNRIVADQQRKLYDRLLQHGIAFFNTLDSSNILMRVTSSATAARSVIDTLIMGFVRDLLTLIGLIFVMIYQQPTLSLFSLIFGPIAILGIRKILSRVGNIVEANLASAAEIIKVVQETSTGIRVVKAFALEKHMAERMNAAITTVESRSNAMARLSGATSPLMETLSGFAIAAVVALSTVSIFGDDATSPGELMSFVTALLMAYEPAKRLARMRISIEAGMVGVGMMYQILDTPIAVKEAPDASPLPKGPGQVAFRNVSFHYENGAPLLRHMDVIFEAGKSTALVGPSGGGKSTIINLILRLYDPVDGLIQIDGFDLRQATFASLRDRIAFVGQETFLFDGTLKQNIALGRENATDEEIIAATKAANAHDFIQRMPQQYDTDVGENGGNLSGGQRQRIAIARAILRDSPILIMDEATSALDSESEYLVNEALQKLSKGRTTIVIAHRLSTILSADKIVVVKEGEVVEEGSQSELLARDGLFRTLYDRQFSTAE